MDVQQFGALLEDYGTRLATGSLTATLEKCYDTIIEGERDIFAHQVGPDGEAWPARLETFETHPLMNETGTLLAAATGGPGHVKRIGARELITGVSKGTSGSLAGAAIHQFGGTIRAKTKEFLSFRLNGRWVKTKAVKIPARPYIGASPETRMKLFEVVSDGVMGEVFHRAG